MRIATLWHVTLRAVQDWWQDNCLRLACPSRNLEAFEILDIFSSLTHP